MRIDVMLQTPLVRGRSHSENLTFQRCFVNKCKTKPASEDEIKSQEHLNIAPLSLQLRIYK